MRHCIEQSNGLVPLLLCPSWVDCIIATRGYDFRKGQVWPIDLDHFLPANFRASFLVATRRVLRRRGREQCQTKSCAPNVMGRELHPVLLVLGPAKDHPQAQYLVAVRNALELDDVAAMFVVVLAKSNQQIQKISKGSNPNDGTLLLIRCYCLIYRTFWRQWLNRLREKARSSLHVTC